MFDRTGYDIREASTERGNSKMPIEIMRSIRSVEEPFIFFCIQFLKLHVHTV